MRHQPIKNSTRKTFRVLSRIVRVLFRQGSGTQHRPIKNTTRSTFRVSSRSRVMVRLRQAVRARGKLVVRLHPEPEASQLSDYIKLSLHNDRLLGCVTDYSVALPTTSLGCPTTRPGVGLLVAISDYFGCSDRLLGRMPENSATKLKLMLGGYNHWGLLSSK